MPNVRIRFVWPSFHPGRELISSDVKIRKCCPRHNLADLSRRNSGRIGRRTSGRLLLPCYPADPSEHIFWTAHQWFTGLVVSVQGQVHVLNFQRARTLLQVCVRDIQIVA